MQALEGIGAILLVMAMIIVPLLVLYGIVKLFWERFVEAPEPIVTKYPQRNNDRVQLKIEHKNTQQILSTKFSYYQKLNAADQAKFLKRTSKFILNKHFRAKEMDLTEEMVVLISASAIQLTFGLEEYLMDHFDKIFIYPSAFYSKINKQYHKGETNLGGVIVLSWKHFNEGYKDQTDNLNLGLHEMAHALRFDKFRSSNYDTFFSEYIDKWQIISKEEFQNIRNKQASPLRDYAGANFSEFFSVCVEYFFESPKEFKSALPDIYKHLCILLNQDPSINATHYNIKNSQTFENKIESEVLIFRFKNKRMSVMWQLLGAIPTIGIILFMTFGLKGPTDFTVLYIFLPIYIVSFTVKIIQSKKHISFYTKGMILESALLKKYNLEIDYEGVVSIVFRKKQNKDEEDSIIVRIINNGKVKKKTYVYTFDNDENIKEAGTFLMQKKIPVKIEGYDVKI